jgi:hypothetical protein
MATYKEIKGVTIQALDDDPVENAGSWSSGGTMNTARMTTLGTATGSSNAFVAGGYVGPPGRVTATESYNGTSWTEVADIPTAYNYGNGIGTNTAAVFAGADPAAATTYLWNGSSWSTPGNDLNQNRFVGGTAGTSTAGAIFGGGEPSASTKQEHWDGTSWTETTDMNTGKKNCFSGSGIQTASMCIGYPNSPFTAEVWNGSAWTEIAELNTARGTGSGAGTTTAALFSGGQAPGYVAHTETYNGTAWTELNNLSTARGYIGNGGSGSSTGTTDAIVYGGSSPPGGSYGVTEEWSFPPPTAATLTEGDIFLSGGTTLKGFGKAAGIPAATWASGGNLNTGRNNASGFGSTNDSQLVAGGSTPPLTAVTELYNGSSWTEVNDMNTARSAAFGFGALQTAGIVAGGEEPTKSTKTESWDGTNWTEVNDLNEATGAAAGGGTQTSAIMAGGRTPGGTTFTTSAESWDGTSWTEVGDLNTGRDTLGGAGTNNTSAIVFGGDTYNGSPPSIPTRNSADTESWDGTSWTEVNNLNTGRLDPGGTGSASLGLCFGGANTGNSENETETWNGTSWTEQSELATASRYMAHGTTGSAVSALCAGGSSTGPSQNETTTQEWTAPATLSTVTVS